MDLQWDAVLHSTFISQQPYTRELTAFTAFAFTAISNISSTRDILDLKNVRVLVPDQTVLQCLRTHMDCQPGVCEPDQH